MDIIYSYLSLQIIINLNKKTEYTDYYMNVQNHFLGYKFMMGPNLTMVYDFYDK